MQKKVCIVTSSRAEWGLLEPLALLLLKYEMQVQLLVTGAHLLSGNEWQSEISENITRVYITPENLSGRQLVFETMSNIFSRIPQVFENLQPDYVVLLGDRYETFAIAGLCRIAGIRIAHISGGEITLGAFDDSLRHAITKLADLHFTATEEYRTRVIQLGEDPKLVFNAGEIGLDGITSLPFKKRELIAREYGLPDKPLVLATFHPETNSPGLLSSMLEEILTCIVNSMGQSHLVITGANLDPEGLELNGISQNLAKSLPHQVTFIENFGRLNYLSAVASSALVIGNSSSGIIEVPALGIPVINLGDRQAGRPSSEGVIHIPFATDLLESAIKRAFSKDFRRVAQTAASPYAGQGAYRKIAEVLKDLAPEKISLKKKFQDIQS